MSATKQKKKVFTFEELLSKANDLMDQCQPQLAIKFFERASEKQRQNSSVLDIMGELYTELAEPEKAFNAFSKSIEIAPDNNPSKWFYIAQLVNGMDSVQYIMQGLEYLKKELAQSQSEEQTFLLKKQLCDGCCSLCELYMTDLCYEENAEETCEAALTEAMNYDVGLPEPTQAYANLRLTQQKKDEALGFLSETYMRLGRCDEHTLPPLEFRLFTGKMLIEVEKYEEAADVLEGVMQEDDENAETWYLVGLCYHHLEDNQSALEFFERCHQMLVKLKKELREEFHLDDQIENVQKLIKTITAGESIVEDEHMDQC